MSEFSTAVKIPVRYRDIDTERHVNNAVYATYLEQARVEYIRDVIGAKPAEPDFVVASITIDFVRPIHLEDEVVVELGVTDIGRSSITMVYEILADGDRAASAESVIVTVDEDGTRPVSDEWRTRIADHEGTSF